MSSSRLVIALARVCTSSTILRRASIARDLRVGIADAAQQILDLGAQVGDLGAVIGDELQIGLAAAADLVDALDFGLDRLHERFALGDRLELLLDAFGGAGQIGEAAFERGDLLLRERELRAALLELLDHGLGALQLIFGGLGLRDRVALARLDAGQLGEELFLDLGGAAEIVADGLHLLQPLGGFGGEGPALLDQLGQAGGLIVNDRLVLLDGLRERLRLLERLRPGSRPAW